MSIPGAPSNASSGESNVGEDEEDVGQATGTGMSPLFGFKALFLQRVLVSSIFEKDPFRYKRNAKMKEGEPGSFLADGKTKKIFTYELAVACKLPWTGRKGGKEEVNKQLEKYYVEEKSEDLPNNVISALASGPLSSAWKGACGNDLALKEALSRWQTHRETPAATVGPLLNAHWLDTASHSAIVCGNLANPTASLATTALTTRQMHLYTSVPARRIKSM